LCRAGENQRAAEASKLQSIDAAAAAGLGKRANRPNVNAVETFAPFAAVIVAHLAGKANAMTAFWATSYFWLRLAHAVFSCSPSAGADRAVHARLHRRRRIFWEVIK